MKNIEKIIGWTNDTKINSDSKFNKSKTVGQYHPSISPIVG